MNFKDYFRSKTLSEALMISNDGHLVYTKQKTKYASSDGEISTFPLNVGFKTQTQDTRHIKIISLYNYRTGNKSTEILSSLKGQGSLEVSDLTYNNFLRDTIQYAVNILSRMDIDYIIYPKSSSSFLKDFILKLEAELPNAKFIHDAIVKRQISELEDLTDTMINKDYYGYDKMKDTVPALIKQIRQNIAKNEADGNGRVITIKNVGFKRNSHIIQKFLEASNDDILNITDKNVLVIDDIIGSGTSFSEMIRVVSEFEPNMETLTGFTIFKGTSTQ